MTVFEAKNPIDFSLDIYPSMFCNYNCSYCFAKSRLNKKYFDTHYYFNRIIDFVKFNSEFSFLIAILGGEPTLIKDFDLELQRLCEVDNIKIVEIITNTSNLDKIIKNPKIIVTISPHIKYFNFEKTLNFLKSWNGAVNMNLPIDRIENILPHLDQYKQIAKLINGELNISPLSQLVGTEKYKEVMNFIFENFSIDRAKRNLNVDSFYINSELVPQSEYIKKLLNLQGKKCICEPDGFDIDEKLQLFWSCKDFTVLADLNTDYKYKISARNKIACDTSKCNLLCYAEFKRSFLI